MKTITIAGGITRDAIPRTTQDGDNVTSFSVAVSEGFGDKKRSVYFDCSLWGKRGSALSPHLTKGSRVAVSGDLSTREHNGKTYLTVRASEVTLLGGGEKREHVNMPPGYEGTAPAEADRGRGPSFDDEIPFAPEWR
jgi:single-strand DNA-binding protein